VFGKTVMWEEGLMEACGASAAERDERPLELLEREIPELAAHIHAATCRWLALVEALLGDPCGAPLAGTVARAGGIGVAGRVRSGCRTPVG
jgi:hypothetical protein